MSPGIGAPHWPLEIRLKQAEKTLEIDFDDAGHKRVLDSFVKRAE